MKSMAKECFLQEPLVDENHSSSVENKLISMQKSAEGLNMVWAEKARMHVKSALEESN